MSRAKRSWGQLLVIVLAACCVHDRVTVNGVPLNETPYLFPGAKPSSTTFNVVVPRGRLWVMGDNRAISDDSRAHLFASFPDQGTVPESEVAGRAFLIIWPPSQLGDLPIPATFQQPALHAGAAGAAVVAFGVPALALWVLRGRRVRAGRRGRRCGCAGARR